MKTFEEFLEETHNLSDEVKAGYPHVIACLRKVWDARQPEIDYWKSLEEKQRQKYNRCTKNCTAATKAYDELKKENEKLRDLMTNTNRVAKNFLEGLEVEND